MKVWKIVKNRLPFGDGPMHLVLHRLEQLRHVRLGKPDGLAFKAHVELQLPVLRLIDEALAAGRAEGIG